jgi:two-component system chemotaxis response regulator CheY
MLKKILIVDDSLFIRNILKRILAQNYDIVEADTGPKAISQFTKEKPDLVLLDIIMPGGDDEGVRVLKEIKKINSNSLVIMITAIGQDVIIQQCKTLGASDYIIKPFDHSLVIKTINKTLS